MRGYLPIMMLTGCAVAVPQQYSSTCTTSSAVMASATQSYCSASLDYTFGTFKYHTMTTNRYATPVKSPVAYTPYASPFSVVSTLIPGTPTYTTYSYRFSPTPTDSSVKYGQSAYRALWGTTTFNDTLLFTTTPSPTPIPKSELVYPPPLYQTCASDGVCIDCYKIPDDFFWGVASSAWQIEGGLMEEGRSPSVLDVIGTFPGSSDANRADMQYYLYKQDILRIAAIGIKTYSFSISWSRVLPFGYANTPINQQAIDHYTDLIDFAIAHGVTPIVTLTHVDTPAVFAGAKGPIGYAATGYQNPKFVESFVYYSKIIMTRFADRVPVWFTFNEPNINTDYWEGYYNVLMAHATVYHFYHNELRGTGRVSFKFANNLAFPLNQNSAADREAARRANEFSLGILGNPTFLGQDYPAVVKATKNNTLPHLSADELAFIEGTVDFFAVDPYTSVFATYPDNGVESCNSNTSDPLWPICVNTTNVQSNGWLMGAPSFAYAYITPIYFRQALNYYNDVYKPKGGIVISEFGFNPAYEANFSLDAQRFDLQRTIYYQEFLSEMLKAIYEDGVKVIGTLAWSILDNNEFGSYDQHYGTQTVNRTTMERHYKRSLFDYVQFFESRLSK